ncbi:hypothetical protein ANCCAN_00744 [Ancylostoma caninum]|uniref:Uncharacterized protein n=1 Tax=Ancylostoma caninum TaxID=29170 RepID=A0A368HCR4_ANCCA|nr:hypothetical protein ANCCAN_00744 [Ancylostoma caninum]
MKTIEQNRAAIKSPSLVDCPGSQREPAKKIAEIEEELYTMAPPVKPVKGGSGEATAYQAPKEKEGKPSRKAKEREDLDKKSKEARKGGPELPDSLRKVKKKQKPTAEQGVTALDPQTAMVQLVPSKEGALKERRKKSKDRKPGAQLAEATQEEGSTRVVKPRKAWSKRFLKWRGSSEKQEEQEEAKPRADVESSEELDYWLFPDGRPTKEFTLSVIPSALSGLLQTDEKAPGQPSLPEPPVPVPGSVPHVPETYGVADRPPPKPARQGPGPSPRGSKELPPVDVRKSPQKRSAEALPKPGGPAMMSPAGSQGPAPKPSAPQPYYFPGVPPPPPRPPPKPPVFPPGPTPQQPTYFPGPPPQPAGGYPPGPPPQQPPYAPGPPAKQPGYPPGASAPQPPAPPPKPPSFPSAPQEDYFAVPPPKPPGPPPGGATKPSKYVPGPGPSAPSAAQDDSYFASPSPAKPPNYFTGGAPPPSSYPTEPQAGQGYGTKPPGAADQQRYPSPTQYQPTRAPQMTQYPPR